MTKRQNSKKMLLLLSAFILALIIVIMAYIGSTQMWYFDKVTKTGQTKVGEISIDIEESQYTIPINKGTVTVPFTIKNQSTIDCFLRIGYGFTAYNKEGKQIPFSVDGVKDIRLNSVKLDEESYQLEEGFTHIPLTGSGQKGMLSLVQRENNQLVYVKVPQTTQAVSGEITLVFEEASSDASFLQDVSQLQLHIVPEAVQGTALALEDLEQYGWNSQLAPETSP